MYTLFPTEILSSSPIPTKTTFVTTETVENYITSGSSMINNPTVSNRENGMNIKL